MVAVEDLTSSTSGATGVYDILCQQNADLDLTLRVLDTDSADEQADMDPVNLTDYTAILHVRPTPTSAVTILEIYSEAESGATENRLITLGGTAGTINIYVAAAKTSLLPVIVGYYDLLLISPEGKTRRWLQGTFTVERGVTKISS